MKLHDEYIPSMGASPVIRVPGGWIYTINTKQPDNSFRISSCFVPFNNEFMVDKNEAI